MNDILIDAQALAEFSNLDTTNTDHLSSLNVGHFQNNHPGFVPDFWWTTKVSPLYDMDARTVAHFANLARKHAGKDQMPDLLLWQEAQRLVRSAWQDKFSPSTCIELIRFSAERSPFEKEERDQRARSREQPTTKKALLKGFEEFRSLHNKIDEFHKKTWPYQQAVMFLGSNAWRAKFCLRCGSRFVATTPKSIYCTDACFQAARKDSKRAWWSEHGQNWRDSRVKKAEQRKKK